MSKKPIIATSETEEEISVILKWGKLVTRITAISATITGAFAAIFSSSSIASGVALTAAGASTLVASEKLPTQGYVKTKHVSPLGSIKTTRDLGSDILKPEIPRLTQPKAPQLPRLEPGFRPIPKSVVGRRGDSGNSSNS